MRIIKCDDDADRDADMDDDDDARRQIVIPMCRLCYAAGDTKRRYTPSPPIEKCVQVWMISVKGYSRSCG